MNDENGSSGDCCPECGGQRARGYSEHEAGCSLGRCFCRLEDDRELVVKLREAVDPQRRPDQD